MIRAGFLSPVDRSALIALARDGSAAHRLARRANALALLDGGMSCAAVAKVLFLDDDTIRHWHELFAADGLDGLARFESGGSAARMSDGQQARLVAWVKTNLPGSTRQIGAFVEKQLGIVYESRSGLIALLHRLGLEYQKPEVIPRRLDEEKQRAFMALYQDLLNSMGNDAAVLFMDAVHLKANAKRSSGNPCRQTRRLLGCQRREAGDRANQRTPAHQHSRRDRSGNRADQRQAALARA